MKKILIIKLASLGDVLVSTPFFSILKKNNYKVLHLVDKNCSIITKENPNIDKFYLFDTNANIFKKIFAILHLIFILRKEKIDVAFNFHRSNILGIILLLSGIKKIYGFQNRISKFYDDYIIYDYKYINRTIQEFNLIKKWNSNLKKPVKLEYYFNKNTNIDKFELPHKYIVCNPGGASNIHSIMENRRLDIEYYDKVFDNLPYKVVIVGNGENDLLISTKIKSKNIINLVNKTTFDETALIIKKSLLYFGNDSSLLFLAAALNKVTLGIFGPTPRIAANPIGNKQYYIESKEICAPCYNPYEGLKGKAYTCNNNICLKNIHYFEVLLKIKRLLKDIK
jgi:heptosyltransferase-2